ncbi:MAG TPA: protein-L-isoaspartate O-methyltransferase [Caulobacteraceae bacterium]|nr:protein-L-isoaspartate O-methyltransferase [Caulobacteraceae bacterium]
MPTDFAAQRQVMVDTQVRPNDVPDLAIQEAMRAVPREAFCPADKLHLAYADAEVDYAPGRALMRPRDVAKLLQALHPKADERALAIAAPYAAGVLEAMGLAVERQDGELKAAPKGAFDVIVCEGAVAEPPAGWLKALAPGGRLAVVVRAGPVGRLRLYVRAAEDIGYRDVFDSAAPMLAGFEPEARFVF